MSAEQRETVLTSEEQLEAILFQFITLYERIAEDRQVTAKQGYDIAKLVKEFSQNVAQFSSLEERVRKDIHTCIKNESNNMTTDIGKTLAKSAFSEVEPVISKLRSATNDGNTLLRAYYSEMRTTHWKIILAAVVSSILTSLLIVWFLMPKLTLSLSSDDRAYMTTGYEIMTIWKKLSKAERSHIENLIVDMYGERAKS